MITERQEKILNALIKEYIDTAEPVSSKLLKKRADLDVSPATIRNDLQGLTEKGFITQPHVSAGRVPTKRAYRHFADKILTEREDEFEDFFVRQIRFAHQQIEHEIKMAEEIMQSLENDNLFEILNILDEWHKKTKN
ncbi:MAG: DeoR family transcriptional regulator [Patescibacteria group bacterium]